MRTNADAQYASLHKTNLVSILIYVARVGGSVYA